MITSLALAYIFSGSTSFAFCLELESHISKLFEKDKKKAKSLLPFQLLREQHLQANDVVSVIRDKHKFQRHEKSSKSVCTE